MYGGIVCTVCAWVIMWYLRVQKLSGAVQLKKKKNPT